MNRSSMALLTMALVATFGAVATSQSARADWSDNFNGGFQQFWQFGSVDAGGNPSPTFNAASINDQLVMADSLSAVGGGAASAFGLVSESFSDVRMTGILNPNGDAGSSGTITLLARGNPFSAQFYAAEINYSTSELIIFRNDSLTSVSNIASLSIPGLTTADSIFMDFRLVGDSLSARAYDAPGGTLLGAVAATDSTYAGGLSGVLVNVTDPDAPMLGVYDDITATIIPEPATALLALVAVSAALVAGGRRRAR
jgi:hypothetical protein